MVVVKRCWLAAPSMRAVRRWRPRSSMFAPPTSPRCDAEREDYAAHRTRPLFGGGKRGNCRQMRLLHSLAQHQKANGAMHSWTRSKSPCTADHGRRSDLAGVATVEASQKKVWHQKLRGGALQTRHYNVAAEHEARSSGQKRIDAAGDLVVDLAEVRTYLKHAPKSCHFLAVFQVHPTPWRGAPVRKRTTCGLGSQRPAEARSDPQVSSASWNLGAGRPPIYRRERSSCSSSTTRWSRRASPLRAGTSSTTCTSRSAARSSRLRHSP